MRDALAPGFDGGWARCRVSKKSNAMIGNSGWRRPMTVIDISCREVWREISNYLEGSIDSELQARMEAHFAVCKHCKAVLDGANNVMKLICDGQVFDVPSGFGERLFSKLR